MPTLNSTVKGVRIRNEMLEELQRRIGEKTLNCWVNEQIAEFIGKPKKDDIESMARLMGMSGERLVEMVCEAIEGGTLAIESGKIVANPHS